MGKIAEGQRCCNDLYCFMLYYIFFRGVTGSAARLFRAMPTALRACESGLIARPRQRHAAALLPPCRCKKAILRSSRGSVRCPDSALRPMG